MKKTILVVDDSDIVLEKAREALEGRGHTVFTASSAAAADQYIFGDPRPDVIIIDVMMPYLDGDQKARMLKTERSTMDIPVLLLSSKSEDELARLTCESGADGFIRKPFTFRDIADKVDAAISL